MRKLIHAELLEQRITVEEARRRTRHPVVGVLENIRSLYNVGSCFRTADAMLLERLVLTGYTPAPPRKEIYKTALGATETVPWEHHASPADAIAGLKASGHHIYALELTEASISLDRLQLPDGPVALVVGNEITGVTQSTLDLCDAAVEIPMYGVKHSLNVAVAFGIATYVMVQRILESPRRRDFTCQ
jgi:23S rRNA (guanosine2251-2'-O)-methyltransferase